MRLPILAALLFALLLGGCAGESIELAPDTNPGEQLKATYFVGKWCDDQSKTAAANGDPPPDPDAYAARLYWNFRDSGKWENSDTGWMFARYGKWSLEGRDGLVLDRLNDAPVRFRAQFANGGSDLLLQAASGQYLIMTRCK